MRYSNPRPALRAALASLLAAAACCAPARATDFLVHPGKDTKVVFTSKATMETFEGKTNKMDGRVSVNPQAVGDSVTVHLEVDLASLDTGMAKRNQHMRENHLETARYPKAVFDGAAVLSPPGAKLEAGKPVEFQIEGSFALHGVTRRLRADATVTWRPAGRGQIAFVATFPVTLADYSIARPEFLFLKLSDTQQVKVSAIASAAP